jgi:large subunit ribosomal protein L23
MNEERLMKVLLSPHVSEKSSRLAENEGRQIAFRVLPDATKLEIRKAVELMFKVEVEGVQVVNVPGKQRRFGRRVGYRGGWRKAYVRLKPGHDIDFVGGQ